MSSLETTPLFGQDGEHAVGRLDRVGRVDRLSTGAAWTEMPSLSR